LHSAWHEDLAIATAVQGVEPLLAGWRGDLGLAGTAPTSGLSEAEDPAGTAAVDVDAPAAYAAAVHHATARRLVTPHLDDPPDVPPTGPRIADIAGVCAEYVPWLHAMWAGKPAAWFVQWEAIGHRQGHLGEMVSVRARLGLSPF